MLTEEEYMKIIKWDMMGENVSNYIDEFNDTTRSKFKEWKEKQTNQIEMFCINYGEINPTEESLINKHGNIVNFGFSFALACDEKTKQETIDAIKTWRGSPVGIKSAKEAGEAYKTIELIQSKNPHFIACWL